MSADSVPAGGALTLVHTKNIRFGYQDTWEVS
jgi:hypothetical protein